MTRRFKTGLAALALMAIAPRPEAQIITAQLEPTDARQGVQERAAPYTVQYEKHVTVRGDRTATETFTRQVKILVPSAVQSVSQQQMFFVEGMETLKTVEAFTVKADGRRVDVDPANII